MFIFTAKVSRGRIAAVLAAALAVCGVTAAAVRMLGTGTATMAAGPDPTGIRTEDDRIAYLRGWGWEVAPGPVAVEELILPKEPDDTYRSYLDLQASQGFQLEKYAGKRVKRYTYTVKNYPTGEDNIQAGLLIYRHRVIAGDVLSNQLGGFLHGLSIPD